MRSIIGTQGVILNAFIFIFFANIFYTSGWGIEVIGLHFFKTKGLSNTSRWTLLVLGTIFTLISTLVYYTAEFDIMFAD